MHPRWFSGLVLLLLGACAAPQQVQTAAPPPVCAEEGLASWYAPHPGQTRMADGARLDPAAMTAAHRRLPFGSEVRVTDLATGRSVTVRITDRGPHEPGRIIDLSPAAARALQMQRAGLARVRVELDAAASDSAGGAGAVEPCPLSRPVRS